jgi:hypothetical protein
MTSAFVFAFFLASAAMAQQAATPPPPPSNRPPIAGTWLETDSEVRLQLDFHVPDAALAAALPAGFTPNVATQGPATNANIRLVFIDRIGVTGPDNRVLGNGMRRMVYLAAPAHDTAHNVNVQVIVGGIVSDPADTPGPFGNYLPATDHKMARSTTADASGVSGEEHWMFAAAGGEHAAFDVAYDRAAPASRGTGDTRFVSGSDPTMVQIHRLDQGLDITWNATTGANRAHDYKWDVGGGTWAKLFDGTEQLLSIDVIDWLTREVYTPAP